MNTRRPRTSCTACRTARIGCDAAIQMPLRCSNCVRREKVCDISTTAVHKRARRTPHDATVTTIHGPENDSISENASWHEFDDHFSFESTSVTSAAFPSLDQDLNNRDFSLKSPTSSLTFLPTPHSLESGGDACCRLQADMLNGMLWDAYFKVFESRFAIWLGNSCSPYLEMAPAPKASISRLVVQLDARHHSHAQDSQRYLTQLPRTLLEEVKPTNVDDRIINNALLNTIYAYAVRWLPLYSAYRKVYGKEDTECQSRQQDVRSYLWHRAKQTILDALTRPSYRSILAILLFTFAEMPSDTDDPGFLELCNQALFSHLRVLRSPLKWQVTRTHPNNPDIMPLPIAPFHTDRAVWCLEEDQHDEDQDRNNVFWLCVVVGCARSLLQQLPSIILPGRSGDDQVWKFIRQRTVIFDQSFRTLRGSQTPLTPDVAEIVLQHATACKTMYYGVISQLCDSLFHHKLSPLQDTAQCVVEEVTRFYDVFDHLLSMCARDYMFLTFESQLHYLAVVTHYHLASLLLADILDSLETVPEVLRDPLLSRSRACQIIINTLSMVLTHDRHSADHESPYGSKILLDTSPELMAEVLLRTGNAVFIMHSCAEIPVSTAQTMLSIVFSALDVLSEISRKASLVKSLLLNGCAARNLIIVEDKNTENCALRAPSSDLAFLAACDTKVAASMLQEMQTLSTENPSYVRDLVKLHEEKLIQKAQSTSRC